MKLRLRIKKNSFDYYLILITPLVDTINGIYLIQNGASGISIGTFYRIFLIAYFVRRIIRYRRGLIQIILMLYFVLIALIHGGNGDGLFGCITYSVKWILPIIIITYYCYTNKNPEIIESNLKKSLDFWCIYVPISLIIEYIFKLGNQTYYDAGFKGYYYSTNDLSLVLITIFIYSISKVTKISKRYIFECLLELISIIILGTKSSIFFAIVAIVIALLVENKISKKIGGIILIIIGIMLINYFMKDELVQIYNRYSNMIVKNNGSSRLNNFLIFATSGRTVRINEYFNKIHNGNIITNFLFGWIYPDNAHVVEMDFHDLFFQYGLIGLLLIIVSYFVALTNNKIYNKPFKYNLIVCLIYAIFAGHVISGALSGTTFSIIFILTKAKNDNITKNHEINNVTRFDLDCSNRYIKTR